MLTAKCILDTYVVIRHFLSIPEFEPMPYLSHYLQAMMLCTRPSITW